jgi:hypothetical protein
MKRSIRAVTTGNGTEPSLSTGYRRVPPSPRLWRVKDPFRLRQRYGATREMSATADSSSGELNR